MKKLILSLLLAVIVLPIGATTPTTNMKFFGACAATMAIGPLAYAAYHFFFTPTEQPQITEKCTSTRIEVAVTEVSDGSKNLNENGIAINKIANQIANAALEERTVILKPATNNDTNTKRTARITLKTVAALASCALLPLISAITVDAATHYPDWASSIATGTLNTITGIGIAALGHSIYKDIKKMNQ
jgi:hypothetical protein